jgi:hypothetical protein
LTFCHYESSVHDNYLKFENTSLDFQPVYWGGGHPGGGGGIVVTANKRFSKKWKLRWINFERKDTKR